MTNSHLTLVYRETAQRPPRAALLPGDDASTWLEALTGSGIDASRLKFLPLSRTSSDAIVFGAMVPLCDRDLALLPVRFVRYGQIANRIYLPLEAIIEPPVAEQEWAALLSGSDTLFVWHAGIGFIRFDPDEVLSLGDLLRLPELEDGDWSRAHPGVQLITRMASLSALLPASEPLLEQGREDIGSKGGDLKDLPRHPRESRWKDIAQAPLLPLAALGAWLKKKLNQAAENQAQRQRQHTTQSAGNPGLIGRFLQRAAAGASRAMQAAAKRSMALTEKLLQQRMSSINRLLHQFETDPDEALRYAIPLGGEAGRGVAPPTGSLVARSTEFRLGGGTGGPVDAWSLPPDLHMSLITRYRQAAEREQRLGRFRRAAFIYSNLIGDHSAAAAALMQGKFFLDAAVLYRDKLHNPLMAAGCLEKGGLLPQAIEIFEQQRQFEKSAALYERLGDAVAAERAYRQAVDDHIKQGHHIAAANLLEIQLRSADEALNLLEQQLGGSSQFRACLDHFFAVCGRAARHDRALAATQELASITIFDERRKSILDLLPRKARDYPDAAVQRAAGESVLAIASRILIADTSDAHAALAAIAQLNPRDRVLDSDCQSYRRQQERPVARIQSVPKSSHRADPVLAVLRSHRLPREAKWHAATSDQSFLYVAGFDSGSLRVVQLPWNDLSRFESVRWERPEFATPWKCAPVILAVTGSSIAVGAHASAPLSMLTLAGNPKQCGTPPWYRPDDDLVADHFRVTCILDASGMLRTCLDGPANGLPLQTVQLPGLAWPFKPSLAEERHLCVRQLGTLVAFDTQLFLWTSQGRLYERELDSIVKGMAVSSFGTTLRVAVFFEVSGLVVWPSLTDFTSARLPDDLVDPAGLFLSDGRLIVWSRSRPAHSSDSRENEFRIFRVTGKELIDIGRAAAGTSIPWKLLPTGKSSEFCLMTREGAVEIWGIGEI